MRTQLPIVWLVLALTASVIGAAGAPGPQPLTPPQSPPVPRDSLFPALEGKPFARRAPAGIEATQGQTPNVALARIGGPAHAVAVRGTIAYIGMGSRLVILDVSDPARPVFLGRTDLLPEGVRGVAVAGPYAYVADGYGGLRIVDVSDPTHPKEVGFYDMPG